ncbi:lasso peptide biosynthesis PqqD family chaperone [Actinoplanes aureus]|uniref:Lasso peptide biosynthesis PqqD family chaperone n=1 Tax=Actinoplanes aureus TaxID=2792083 RepID=A0A931CFY7_9ACTN|nr:lasso peptide biosynthesis PqqD family chaperone [Actinoplanes aureus]MBG0569195.1 lasso peptide biosynthesis PqqD family chaperone [Actinoplanes aureus]
MTLRLHDDIVLNETEYGAVLLNQRRGTYWQLNPTGTAIIKAMLENDDVEATAKVLAERFDVDFERACQDVRSLVAEMQAAGAFR